MFENLKCLLSSFNSESTIYVVRIVRNLLYKQEKFLVYLRILGVRRYLINCCCVRFKAYIDLPNGDYCSISL